MINSILDRFTVAADKIRFSGRCSRWTGRALLTLQRLAWRR